MNYMRIKSHFHIIIHILFMNDLYPHRMLLFMDMMHLGKSALLQQEMAAKAIAGSESGQRNI